MSKQYVKPSPDYRQEHSLTYKLILTFTVVLIWAATIFGAWLAN